MFIWAWASLAPYTAPLFIVAGLAFLASVFLIARHSGTVANAAEYGALVGYLFGVAVWGSLGYYFDFTPENKILIAGSAIVDSTVLCALARYVFAWYERRVN